MKPIIVFFDGYCVLCNFWVKKLCKWDKKDRLRFTTLDSKMAFDLKAKSGFDLKEVDSILVWDQQNNPLVEAAGVFKILEALGDFWRVFLIFKILPLTVLNRIYRGIAKNRVRWFGKNTSCPLPDTSFQHKFI